MVQTLINKYVKKKKNCHPGKDVFLLWRLKKAFNSIWHAWLNLKWLQCVMGGKAWPKD